jgi:hypothetical protein
LKNRLQVQPVNLEEIKQNFYNRNILQGLKNTSFNQNQEEEKIHNEEALQDPAYFSPGNNKKMNGAKVSPFQINFNSRGYNMIS